MSVHLKTEEEHDKETIFAEYIFHLFFEIQTTVRRQDFYESD